MKTNSQWCQVEQLGQAPGPVRISLRHGPSEKRSSRVEGGRLFIVFSRGCLVSSHKTFASPPRLGGICATLAAKLDLGLKLHTRTVADSCCVVHESLLEILRRTEQRLHWASRGRTCRAM